jgi:hypothetical protein
MPINTIKIFKSYLTNKRPPFYLFLFFCHFRREIDDGLCAEKMKKIEVGKFMQKKKKKRRQKEQYRRVKSDLTPPLKKRTENCKMGKGKEVQR